MPTDTTNNTVVSPQITDAVTQTNVKVLGDAPAQAMGNVYQVEAHETGNTEENSVANQEQTNESQQNPPNPAAKKP